jgi:hypothetical protein
MVSPFGIKLAQTTWSPTFAYENITLLAAFMGLILCGLAASASANITWS